MKSFIITKWIEPYILLETVKKYCELTDYSFDGLNKVVQKNKMLVEIEKDPKKFALYMKNVNKFYVFTPKNDFDLRSILIETFNFSDEDYKYSYDCEESINMIDMGKAEASFINADCKVN